MSAEIHQRLLGFLLGEFAKTENHTCISLELVFSPAGYKDEPIQEWIRKTDPDLFEPAQTPDFCSLIIDIAAGEADAKPPGRHRFVVRTKQFLHGQASQSFALQPSYTGEDPSIALMAAQGGGRSGGNGELQIIANHANQLMRNNTQIFDGSIRVLVATNQMLSKENGDLRIENFKLKGEVEAAKHDRLKDEFEISMAVDKNNRANAGWQKALQLGTVLAARITGGTSGTEGNQGGAQAGPSPLHMLVAELKNSLMRKPETIAVLMNAFDMSEKILFSQIMEIVTAVEQQQAQQQQPGAPTNGFPTP